MADQKETIPVHNVPGYGTVHFPKTMTEEQIGEAIANLPSQQKLKDWISDQTWMSRDMTEKPSTMERIGHGAMRTVDRLTQLNLAAGEKLGIYEDGTGRAFTNNINEEEARYQKLRGPDAGLDIASALGGVGMTAPLALLPGGQSYLGSIGWGLLTGGAEGLLQYDPSYSLGGTAKNVGTGAIAGGIAAPLMRAVSQGAQHFIRSGFGKLKGIMASSKGAATADEILNEVPEMLGLPVDQRASLIIEAQRQIKETGELNLEQLARKANLIANDVTPTKSMVTRSPRDWAMERNLQKLSQSPDQQLANVGQELTDVYRGNDAALAARLRGFMDGLPQATQEGHGRAIMEALDSLSTTSQKDVSALYKMVREQSGDNLASDARSLFSTLEDLRDNTYAEKLVGSVTNKLKRFGMIDKDGALTNNTLTVTQAEELRKFVNTLPNDFGKKDIIKAIDADVLQGAGGDAFEVARKAAQSRFAMLDNPATQRALNAYGELTQGKTAQNFIKTQVIDGAEEDVETLLKTLGKLPNDKAAEAQLQMRAGVLDYLQDTAVNKNSGQFSGAKLSTAMDKIGEGKLRMILGEQGYKELKSLAKAGVDSTYQPAYAAVNHSNTAPTLLSWTQRARAVPGPNLLVLEGAEKIAARKGYEKQLGNALAAGIEQPLPQIPARVQSLIRLIQSAGAPGAAGLAEALRNKPEKRSD